MYFRSFNPIWWLPDLVGNPLDDTYFMFVLQNTIPYIPKPIYQTSSGTEWINPIQFLANGTLPDNMYWDVGTASNPMVYRLEIRKGNTQSSPLIYLIENYIPGTEGGGSPPTDIGFTTENQISNPQFAVMSVFSPFTFTSASGATIQVAPGWSLVLGTPASSGTVTITQVPLNNSAGTINPTNAPYALQITSSGWTSVTLIQQFSQNGMLWTSNDGTINYVSMSITAQTQGAVGSITAQLVDSNGTNLGILLNNVQIDNGWNEYSGIINPMPPTTNPNLPPAAYIQLQITNLLNLDIYLTSFQLVNSNVPLEFNYEEDSVERQIDHLFHYYLPMLNYKQTPSYLCGWDFPLNPAQILAPSGNISINGGLGQYICDQTIVYQSANSALDYKIGQSDSSFGGLVLTATSNTQLAIIQYLNQAKLYEMLVNNLSVGLFQNTNQTALSVTVSLWYTTGSLPNVAPGTNLTLLNGSSALNSMGYPVNVVAGWTEIKNANGTATYDPSTGQVYGFSGWKRLGFPFNATYFAIVIGTSVLNSGNYLATTNIGLIPGDIPTLAAPQSEDEVLRECQYYYEQSYSSGLVAGSNSLLNAATCFMPSTATISSAASGLSRAAPFEIVYNTIKRYNPNVTLYTPAGLMNNVKSHLYILVSSAIQDTAIDISVSGYWTATGDVKSIFFIPNNSSGVTLTTSNSTPSSSYSSAAIIFQWVADARLGIV